ncbi:hypothetical protein MIND_00636800 [Mycena indigotica]|uniref:NADP-dependent oxidoreductase domain-containing protein n=1 Tax=Mycena indigotica TaxID=2126181 RepID=A0A8H6SRG0_9AGAR|nr:uncharacterized protein MIND_00636800 [Mycena indigotica]KAF7304054.1 hypothetical protein MIND_00636800 [Mycena indigotica]
MPWTNIPLNDGTGTSIPSLAFGTAGLEDPAGTVEQALSLGVNHIDTAQIYGNENEAGVGIRDSALPRDELYVTTKFSGGGPELKSIKESFQDSLDKLGTTYIDLYLIHSPRWAQPDIPSAWKELEDIRGRPGQDLTILLASAKVKPAVNQILLHPYVFAQQKPILEFSKKHGIVIEAYSPLMFVDLTFLHITRLMQYSPLRRNPGGPLDKPVQEIATRLGVTPEQVLLAWTKAKGAVVITTSTKKERVLGYLHAGDLELTEEDIAAIDTAGALGLPLTFSGVSVSRSHARALALFFIFGLVLLVLIKRISI